MSNFEHPGGYKSMNDYPDMAKSFNGLVPYTSVAQVNSLILIGIRHIGLTVNINNVEYWYKENKTDEGLVLKVADFVIESLDSKLDKTDYNDRFKGVYLTLASLKSTYPTGIAGDYAQVNESGAEEVLNYNWDVEKSDWVANAVAGFSANNTDELPEGSTNLYSTLARFVSRLTLERIVTALGFTPANVDTTYTRTVADDTFLPVGGGTLLGNTTIGQFCILVGSLTNGIRFRDSTNNNLNFSISDNGDTFTRGTAAIAAGTAANHAVNKGQLDLKSDLSELSQNLTFEATAAGGAETFVLPSDYFSITGVYVQGVRQSNSQYTLSPPRNFTLTDDIAAGNYVQVQYSTKEAENNAPYYTQAQADAYISSKVALNGNQTINGIKTFNDPIVGNLQGNADTADAATLATLINATDEVLDADFPITFASSLSEAFVSLFVNSFITYNPFSKLLKLVNATFSGVVIVPNGTAATHAVNKSQLDPKAIDTAVLHKTGNETIEGSLTINGKLIMGSAIKLKGYTYNNLPTGVVGDRAYITNGSALNNYGQVATGGGTTVMPVFHDGSNWVVR
jgi:hypothetical protein